MRKISKKELEVLKLLIGINEGLTGYAVTQKLYSTGDTMRIVSKRPYIYFLLERLVKKRAVIKINSYPTFYKISPHMRNEEFTKKLIYEVVCPACKENSWIHEGQITKQCPSCTKSNGNPRRFYITTRRYTGGKKEVI